MPALLSLHDISKTFGAVQALDGISLALQAGEVVALIGDNGAGKSTLIKIVSGALMPDAGGEIRFQDRKVSIRAPGDARRLGIETIYQDLALFENADVAGNIFAGREDVRRIFGLKLLRQRRMHAESAELLGRLKVRVHSTRALVKGLSGGQRQSVAIARAVKFARQVLILDEPTAALGVPEQEKVLALIAQLRGEGYLIVLISHNLDHIFRAADRLIVLRQGRLVGDLRRQEADPDRVVALMTGADRVTAHLHPTGAG